MLIIVDAMGGDNAPFEIVNGCINAIIEKEGFDVQVLGNSALINEIVKKRNFFNKRLKIKHTSEVITNDDIPTRAIKTKKDSSMVVGFKMLKESQGDAFISAGNTGALMTGALLLLGRMKGIDRPALAPIIPTSTGGAMLVDAGLNTNCKPINYFQFGIIGSIYMKEIFKIRDPKIGLINVGTEDNKGTKMIKQSKRLLEKADINFVGNIEGKDFPAGKVNVAVCDGFTGNVILKFTEGIGSFIFSELKEVFNSGIVSKLAALSIKGKLKNFKKKLDPEEYGGTPILGVNGRVFKCHGSSNAKAIKNSIIKAYEFASTTVLDQIRDEFKNMEVEKSDD